MILTGAARGIGRHVAHALAEAGASVGLTDLSSQGMDAVADELAAGGTRMTAAAFDGASEEQFAAFHRRVRDELGEVDGLITCAGALGAEPFDEVSAADLKGCSGERDDGVRRLPLLRPCCR